VYMSLPHYYY